MSKTIRELSKELGISRNGVEVRIEKVPAFRPKYTKRVHNRVIIDDEGCKILKKMGNNQHSNYNVNYSNSNYTNYIKYLKKLSQNEKKHNQQIQKLLILSNSHEKKLEDMMEKLERLLNQQQELQLSSNRENNRLRGQIKRMSDNNDHRGVHPSAQNKPHRRGFWRRLFGKK